jgi:hypothetical protein
LDIEFEDKPVSDSDRSAEVFPERFLGQPEQLQAEEAPLENAVADGVVGTGGQVQEGPDRLLGESQLPRPPLTKDQEEEEEGPIETAARSTAQCEQSESISPQILFADVASVVHLVVSDDARHQDCETERIDTPADPPFSSEDANGPYPGDDPKLMSEEDIERLYMSGLPELGEARQTADPDTS